jgi:hypothetical protein
MKSSISIEFNFYTSTHLFIFIHIFRPNVPFSLAISSTSPITS